MTQNSRDKASFKRAIALILLTGQILSPSVSAQTNLQISHASPFKEIRVSSKLQQMALPKAWGKIREKFIQTKETASPLIVHIADAHSNYEAQIHTKKILNYLKEEYGFKTVFLEGAFGRLDPKLLHFFQDSLQNKKAADMLAQEGIAGGTELFLLDHPDAMAFGAENPALYKESLRLFRAILNHQPASRKFLDRLRGALLKDHSHRLNPELRKFFSDWIVFQNSQRELTSHLKILRDYALKQTGVDLKDPANQVQWPQLIRYFKLQDLEASIRNESFKEESKKIISFIQANPSLAKHFSRMSQFVERPDSLKHPRSFFEQFYDEAVLQGFSFEHYPEFSRKAGYFILQNEIDPRKFFLEIEYMTDRILKSLVKTETEKAYVRLYQDYLLAEKMLNVELVSAEYAEVASRVESLWPSVLVERFQAVSRSKAKDFLLLEDLELVDALFAQGLDFYDLTEDREEFIFQNMIKKIKKVRTDKAVLITGGFHSEGLLKRLRKADISYIEIEPSISTAAQSQSYENVMLLQGAKNTLNAYLNHFSLTNPLGRMIRAFLGTPDAMQGAALINDALGRILAEKKGSLEQEVQALNASPAFKGHGLNYKWNTDKQNEQAGILHLNDLPVSIPGKLKILGVTVSGPKEWAVLPGGHLKEKVNPRSEVRSGDSEEQSHEMEAIRRYYSELDQAARENDEEESAKRRRDMLGLAGRPISRDMDEASLQEAIQSGDIRLHQRKSRSEVRSRVNGIMQELPVLLKLRNKHPDKLFKDLEKARLLLIELDEIRMRLMDEEADPQAIQTLQDIQDATLVLKKIVTSPDYRVATELESIPDSLGGLVKLEPAVLELIKGNPPLETGILGLALNLYQVSGAFEIYTRESAYLDIAFDRMNNKIKREEADDSGLGEGEDFNFDDLDLGDFDLEEGDSEARSELRNFHFVMDSEVIDEQLAEESVQWKTGHLQDPSTAEWGTVVSWYQYQQVLERIKKQEQKNQLKGIYINGISLSLSQEDLASFQIHERIGEPGFDYQWSDSGRILKINILRSEVRSVSDPLSHIDYLKTVWSQSVPANSIISMGLDLIYAVRKNDSEAEKIISGIIDVGRKKGLWYPVYMAVYGALAEIAYTTKQPYSERALEGLFEIVQTPQLSTTAYTIAAGKLVNLHERFKRSNRTGIAERMAQRLKTLSLQAGLDPVIRNFILLAVKTMNRYERNLPVENLEQLLAKQLAFENNKDLLVQRFGQQWDLIKNKGAFVFDMQKTLVARKQSLTAGMLSNLAWLLGEGVRLVIITGNADDDVIHQVIYPLREYLIEHNHLAVIKNLTVYANSGTIRFDFDSHGKVQVDREFQKKYLIDPEFEKSFQGAVSQLGRDYQFYLDDREMKELEKTYREEEKNSKTTFKLPWISLGAEYQPSVIGGGVLKGEIVAPYIERRGIYEGQASALAIKKIYGLHGAMIIEALQNILGSKAKGYTFIQAGDSTIDAFREGANKAVSLLHWVEGQRRQNPDSVDWKNVYYFGDALFRGWVEELQENKRRGNDLIILDYPSEDPEFKNLQAVALNSAPPEGLTSEEKKRTYYLGRENNGLEILLKDLSRGDFEQARSEIRPNVTYQQVFQGLHQMLLNNEMSYKRNAYAGPVKTPFEIYTRRFVEILNGLRIIYGHHFNSERTLEIKHASHFAEMIGRDWENLEAFSVQIEKAPLNVQKLFRENLNKLSYEVYYAMNILWRTHQQLAAVQVPLKLKKEPSSIQLLPLDQYARSELRLRTEKSILRVADLAGQLFDNVRDADVLLSLMRALNLDKPVFAEDDVSAANFAAIKNVLQVNLQDHLALAGLKISSPFLVMVADLSELTPERLSKIRFSLDEEKLQLIVTNFSETADNEKNLLYLKSNFKGRVFYALNVREALAHARLLKDAKGGKQIALFSDQISNRLSGSFIPDFQKLQNGLTLSIQSDEVRKAGFREDLYAYVIPLLQVLGEVTREQLPDLLAKLGLKEINGEIRIGLHFLDTLARITAENQARRVTEASA